MCRSRYVDPHAVLECATGNLVVRSNDECDLAPGLPSRMGAEVAVDPTIAP